MARLTVNPGTEIAWEIPLKPGVNFLGRGEGNDFIIEDPSISSTHCQVTVKDSGVIVKDLGSTNGVFVNNTRVDEALVLNGQMFRLGDVTMQVQCPPTPTAAPSISAPVPQPSSAFCKVHRNYIAQFFCPKCRNSFCDMCVSSRQGRKFCRVCSVECVPLEHSPASSEPEPSFADLVRDAFAYPIKGDGVILLVGGGIFLMVINAAKFIVRFALFYGAIALIFLTIFGTGYLAAYLRRILTSSAAGEKQMPDWPEISDFSSDVASPFFQLLGTSFFCFFPTTALTIFAFFAPEGSTWLGWATTASIIFGCAYFPMAFMAVAMFDSVAAVNPLLIVPSILKIPREYLLTIVLFAVILTVRWLGQSVLPELLQIPILPSVFASFVGLYLLAVEMRMLGLLYFSKKDELCWFGR